MANIVVLGTNIFAKARESVYSASLTKASYRWTKKLCTLLDLCVSSLRRGHANLLCIVPILTDDPRRESEVIQLKSLSDCTDKLRSALHAYSRGFRGLSPKKILAPNSRNF